MIEVNNRYSSSAANQSGQPFCKSYRILKPYREGQYRLYELTRKPLIKKVCQQRLIDPVNLKPTGMHFASHFDSVELITGPLNAGFFEQATRATWKSGQAFAIRCDYGRFHSLVTQLPRQLRPFVRIDGSAAAMVDVSAAQPLLLGHLCNQPEQAHQIRRAVTGRDSATTGAAIGAGLLPYVAQNRTTPSDVHRWLKYCETGTIYEHLQRRMAESDSPINRFNMPNGYSVEADLRSASIRQVKKAALVCMFDTIESSRTSPVFQAIEQDFPTIARFMLVAKRSDYSDLAKMLQMAESTLMIDRVGDLLMAQYPDEPVQPIHDALLVRTEFKEVAKTLIETAFNEVGLNPNLKIEACNDAAVGGLGEPVALVPDSHAGRQLRISDASPLRNQDVLRN